MNRFRSSFKASLACCLTVMLATAAAQSPSPDAAASAPQDAVSQLKAYSSAAGTVGGSPAATILGIGSDKVEHPSTVNKLAMSVLHGLDPTGGTSTGFALDFAPQALFVPQTIDAGKAYAGAENDAADLGQKLDAFRQHWLDRIANRTTLSLASANVATPSASTAVSGNAVRMAWGARIGLIDNGDPGLYYAAIKDCWPKLDPGMAAPKPGDKPASAPADANAAAESCAKARMANLHLDAKLSIYAGFGQSWYLDRAGLAGYSNATSDVKVAWLSGSWGYTSQVDPKDVSNVNKHEIQTLVQGYIERRLDDRAASTTTAGAFVRQDATQGLLRLRTGNDRWHAFGEAGLNRLHLGDATRQNTKHYALGAEFSASFLGIAALSSTSQNWFQLALVSERGYLDGKAHNALTFGYKFGQPFMGAPTGESN